MKLKRIIVVSCATLFVSILWLIFHRDPYRVARAVADIDIKRGFELVDFKDEWGGKDGYSLIVFNISSADKGEVINSFVGKKWNYLPAPAVVGDDLRSKYLNKGSGDGYYVITNNDLDCKILIFDTVTHKLIIYNSIM